MKKQDRQRTQTQFCQKRRPKPHFKSWRTLISGIRHETKTEELRDAYWALRNLLQLPWWQRIWTVQEALLPSFALLRCGNAEMWFHSFSQAMIHIEMEHSRQCCHPYWLYIDETLINNFYFLQEATSERRLRKDQALLFSLLLNMFRGRLASDPRDKVVALSGLAGTVTADYSLATNDAFMYAARTSITDTGSLAPLLRVPELNRTTDLPSWAPDWRAGLDPVTKKLWGECKYAIQAYCG
ncbi:hypothetical protein QBC34DRAFT_212842 [Podospora aff. communis PSN243]|uniref:Heterokaryon incompatibility domain-containing protein n=1 Tax=Podospora aff. communis PSN243 TaxID=3040156 RepID=A0AAV9G5R2_9PEZI|nr:hypothetical protein QBC34DRAFT_212842 [Podospora aff. communis PSN243]